MEHLQFEKKAEKPDLEVAGTYSLRGVVSSGNLEVLMEVKDLAGKCRFEIDTAAEGFEQTWEAVVNDFMLKNSPGNLFVSVNDYAASPDVVGLRLGQAYEALKGGTE